MSRALFKVVSMTDLAKDEWLTRSQQMSVMAFVNNVLVPLANPEEEEFVTRWGVEIDESLLLVLWVAETPNLLSVLAAEVAANLSAEQESVEEFFAAVREIHAIFFPPPEPEPAKKTRTRRKKEVEEGGETETKTEDVSDNSLD